VPGAADGTQGKDGEHRVQLDASGQAGQVAVYPDRHPHDEREQGRWPDPGQHLTGRTDDEQQEAAGAHEHRRDRGPALRLVGEPLGEPEQ
jgi:hypothetical protein